MHLTFIEIIWDNLLWKPDLRLGHILEISSPVFVEINTKIKIFITLSILYWSNTFKFQYNICQNLIPWTYIHYAYFKILNMIW